VHIFLHAGVPTVEVSCWPVATKKIIERWLQPREEENVLGAIGAEVSELLPAAHQRPHQHSRVHERPPHHSHDLLQLLRGVSVPSVAHGAPGVPVGQSPPHRQVPVWRFVV
jgi:hypothetical protein